MKILVVLFFHMDEKKTNYTSSCLFYQDEMEILICPDHSFYRHGFTKKKIIDQLKVQLFSIHSRIPCIGPCALYVSRCLLVGLYIDMGLYIHKEVTKPEESCMKKARVGLFSEFYGSPPSLAHKMTKVHWSID